MSNLRKQNKPVLFILKSSKGTFTGQYIMNSYIYNSSLIKERFDPYFLILYASTYKFPPLRILHAIINTFKNALHLLCILITYKPRVVFFNISPVKAFLRDIIYVYILKKFKVKRIYQIHGRGIREKASNNKIYKHLYVWAYKKVDAICLSKKLFYEVDFLPVNYLWVVPNGIPKYIENTRQISNSGNSSPVKLLFISNLIKSKGVEIFISALKMLVNKGYDIKGLIVGAEMGYSANNIKVLVGNYDNYIFYLGPKYGKEKHEVLLSSDIFILPTNLDTFPVVLLEALQFGLPIITTDEGAITDIVIDGENGYIVEKNNPEMIAEKVKKLVDNPELKRTIGSNNYKRYNEHYTVERFEKNICKAIANLL